MYSNMGIPTEQSSSTSLLWACVEFPRTSGDTAPHEVGGEHTLRPTPQKSQKPNHTQSKQNKYAGNLLVAFQMDEKAMY